MISLKLDTPISLRVKPKIIQKPKPVSLSLKRRIIRKVKKILSIKKDAVVPIAQDTTLYINEYFNNSHFNENVYINSYYGGGIIEIGENCLIMGGFNIEGPNGKIKIGTSTFIGGNTQLNSMNSISIGNNVLIAANCVIQDHNSHSTNYLERRNDINLTIRRFLGNPAKDKNFDIIANKSIVIEDDVWIGMGVYILKGVTIGARSIIGAGSVVTKDVPSDTIYAGNPASFVKKLK
ncbi:DapH/DapD/GlmU-related protein [Cytophagaceae bacterium YF14B1]|uniref:DapH/DapD/GlmU-related protein n=1 Tax=Xanthocytophaga flava TaxID=3048013 RepID=A0AAE3QS05_9BACT|nr:DapH/DapD/GlmU-related protein [Xanthocytophaga flavus]MDJ1482170.1 DapH/DapD/GlmU-related protein [Xanthocytophaga flavus]